tara:strand:+ start:2363 stop:2986 length:624 start_codon:yes stop_codon:yes gene_type:complete
MVGGMVVQGITALIAMGKANGMKSSINSLESDITTLANNRQNIPDLSTSLEDLSGSLSNPYANLGVATQAAQIQMEQTDIALANTLDTIAQAGLGAGGATALAQAAARSKREVSANIEQQEAQNEKMKAQGEQQLQQQVMSEKIRMQQGEMAADQFAFGALETRQLADLNRAQGLYDNALAQQMQYRSDAFGALGQLGSSAIQFGAQ